MDFINTNFKLSELNARDAIYIGTVEQSVSKSELIFKGQIDGDFLDSKKDFVNFTLLFKVVNYYSCTFLDFAAVEIKMTSNFNIIRNSEYLIKNNLSGYKHYALSTYDFNYQIIAKECKLIIE